LGVLSETLGLKRPQKKITWKVSIKYQVLNGKNLTNMDDLKCTLVSIFLKL